PADIILGGDSAGGGLALGLLHSIIAEGLPVPAGVVTYSPWTDLTASGASLQFNANADPLLPARRIAEIGAEYLNGADPQTPSASPLFGEFPNAPPVYIHVGSTEVLLDDARRMAERLREFGARVELQIDDQTPHVLPMFFGAAPESTRAIIDGARFIDSLGTAVSTKDN
ncbi:MAG TPA: alpha/beta hydrolase fold domain-containing protein, partial [Paracoccaceae bacterium]|nr:alpha/beta hydrolase fold domain-containing protein [Paracoccaceae bacterium]